MFPLEANALSIFLITIIQIEKYDTIRVHKTGFLTELRNDNFDDAERISEDPTCNRNLDYIKDGRLNKGLNYSSIERQKYGITGLLPPAEKTQEILIEQCRRNLERLAEPLDRYIYLSNLQETNERLFYKLIFTNITQLLPIVYTPVVGQACQKFSLIFQKPPKGLFISINDADRIDTILNNWPSKDIRAIVVTDGERILGLGDLGANGMGIPVGKLSLYTILGGIKPDYCLPVVLDVGTNTESILNDPFYIGLRQKRVQGEEYDNFVDKFMKAVVNKYGPNTLIQFEDFGDENAIRFLNKYRNDYCTYNGDIQGTAAVTVAGLLASLKITKTKLSDHVIIFQGAGEISLGIAELCVMAMRKEGVSEEEAKKKIYLVDSKGLIVNNRPGGNLTEHQKVFAKDIEPIEKLKQVIKKIKPSILIGASGINGVFTPEIITDMASFHKAPVIFALSNPTSKSECTAEEAYTYSDGRAIFASGSPFAPVKYGGKQFEPGQCNNVYVFPGVSLGVIISRAKTISDDLFLIAAQTLSDLVQKSDLEVGRLYPPIEKTNEYSVKIATKIMEAALKTGIATIQPEPSNLEEYIRSQMYNPNE